MSGHRTVGRQPDNFSIALSQFQLLSAGTRSASAASMTTTSKVPLAERPLPAVHEAIMELQSFVDRFLESVPVKTCDVTRISRAIERACLAIELGSNSERWEHHLNRAKDAIVLSLGLFRQLCRRRLIDGSSFALIERRISRVFAGLEQLGESSKADWASVPMPPEEADRPDEQPGASPAVAVLTRVIARASAAFRALRQARAPRRAAKKTKPPAVA